MDPYGMTKAIINRDIAVEKLIAERREMFDVLQEAFDERFNRTGRGRTVAAFSGFDRERAYFTRAHRLYAVRYELDASSGAATFDDNIDEVEFVVKAQATAAKAAASKSDADPYKIGAAAKDKPTQLKATMSSGEWTAFTEAQRRQTNRAVRIEPGDRGGKP